MIRSSQPARAAGALLVPLAILVALLTPADAHATDEDSGRFFAALGRPDWSAVGSTAPRLGPGAADAEVQPRGRARGRRVASLGGGGASFDKPSVTGGGRIAWVAPARCLASSLASVVAEVAAQFGAVRVSSTCRSRGHNARVGGARRSLHLSGSAVDFRVFGNVRAVHAFLRSHSSVGGLKHYGGGLFHIDTGARRRM